jgi:predicted ATPase/DNA-binding winged helix-turn-helix (wHTH) protein
MDSASTLLGDESFVFGDFEIVAAERRLLRGGVPVRVGSRSLDILIALISRRGEIIAKDDLIAAVWPDTIVEESALRVHISTLRKALGDGEGDVRLITNVPGRGYCFVSPVTVVAGRSAPPAAPSNMPPTQRAAIRRLPALVARIIGRDALIEDLTLLAARQRLLTIVGPGGMGKTTIAVAVADCVVRLQDREAVFIDLASLADPALAPGAAASALGLAVRSEDTVQDIADAVRDRRVLLVFDSCEHLIDAAAELAESLLSRAPGISILATSREALRADGEWVHRLQPLESPPISTALTAAEALRYPAVQMFVERASAVLGGYRLDDTQAPLVAEICRRLDGIALAIELATGRLDSMSVRALADSLENCFQVLTRGRRTALARHQTLRGTIDWSYGILPVEEQVLLRRLGAFNGPFTLQAAKTIAGHGQPPHAVEDGLLNLVAKSLLTADLDGREARYRLLDTTRAYALEKVEESGEGPDLRRRHATYYRDLFARAEAEWEARPTAEWLVEYAGQLGNLRAALDWAFGDDGEGAVGVALTVAAVPLWFQLSLVDECLARVQGALTWLEASSEPGPRARMQLYSALGFPQMRAITGFPSGIAAWRSTLRIAGEIGDTDYEARALWALWTDRVNNGEAREALALAERFAELARGAPKAADPLIAQRIRGWSRLMLGDLEGAHDDITSMLRAYGAANRRGDVARFQYDQRGIARITLARTLWLRGRADQSLEDVEDNIADVTASDHILSLAHVLSDTACFVALWRGDLDLAEHYIAQLRLHTGLQALDVWRTYGDCFEGEMRIRRGDVAGGLSLLRRGIATLEAAGFVCYHTAFLGWLADGLQNTGAVVEASAAIETALAQCARTGEAWCSPELLRVQGEILLKQKQPSEAERSFRASFDMAEAQGALAWSLRTAISWAGASGLEADARERRGRLAAVIARFGEGFDTSDLRAARALLVQSGG